MCVFGLNHIFYPLQDGEGEEKMNPGIKYDCIYAQKWNFSLHFNTNFIYIPIFQTFSQTFFISFHI